MNTFQWLVGIVVMLVITPLKAEFPVKWDVDGGVRYRFSSESQEEKSLLGADFKVNRNNRWVDEWTLEGEGLKELTDGKETAQRGEVSLRYGRSFIKEFYGFGRIQADHDKFEGISHREDYTGGVGYWLVDERDARLVVEGGLGWQEKSFVGSGVQDDAIGFLKADGSFKAGRTEVGAGVEYTPSLERNDWRTKAEAYLLYRLTDHLYAEVTAQDRYRNVSAGRRNTTNVMIGFRYKL